MELDLVYNESLQISKSFSTCDDRTTRHFFWQGIQIHERLELSLLQFELHFSDICEFRVFGSYFFTICKCNFNLPPQVKDLLSILILFVTFLLLPSIKRAFKEGLNIRLSVRSFEQTFKKNHRSSITYEKI